MSNIGKWQNLGSLGNLAEKGLVLGESELESSTNYGWGDLGGTSSSPLHLINAKLINYQVGSCWPQTQTNDTTGSLLRVSASR